LKTQTYAKLNYRKLNTKRKGNVSIKPKIIIYDLSQTADKTCEEYPNTLPKIVKKRRKLK
jgi:hypothetical protein